MLHLNYYPYQHHHGRMKWTNNHRCRPSPSPSPSPPPLPITHHSPRGILFNSNWYSWFELTNACTTHKYLIKYQIIESSPRDLDVFQAATATAAVAILHTIAFPCVIALPNNQKCDDERKKRKDIDISLRTASECLFEQLQYLSSINNNSNKKRRR